LEDPLYHEEEEEEEEEEFSLGYQQSCANWFGMDSCVQTEKSQTGTKENFHYYFNCILISKLKFDSQNHKQDLTWQSWRFYTFDHECSSCI
jgi:hypothetical protein